MKPSQTAIILMCLLSPNTIHGFLNSPNGSPDPVSKIIKDELLKEDANRIETPPIVNHLLKTSEQCQVDYWSRPDIHTLGNVGFGGAVHAAMAPLATKVSDVAFYSRFL
jgi:hypothetical protein